MLYRTALSMTRGVTPALLLRMEECGMDPRDFFDLSAPELMARLGISDPAWVHRLNRDEALFEARAELDKISRHGVKPMFFSDKDFPSLLRETPDSPRMLFTLGDCDLNSRHILSVVGTRRCTSYGISFTSRLVEELHEAFPDLVVVSGLAYGIDEAAHEAALRVGAFTAAVLAHGLHVIYPAAHRDLARRVLRGGGSLITEYTFGEKPFRQRFLERNRIVAGLSAVTVVVESDIKGGAMSTANMAFSYSREVMALPGRVGDSSSAGCNHLIRMQKASLITCAADLIDAAGWKPETSAEVKSGATLFPELEGDNLLIYDTLRFSAAPVAVDALCTLTSLPVARLLAALGEMEFEGLVERLPGNRYGLA